MTDDGVGAFGRTPARPVADGVGAFDRTPGRPMDDGVGAFDGTPARTVGGRPRRRGAGGRLGIAWLLPAFMIVACGQAGGQGAYQGTALMGAAPGFSLTDQAGKTWRLSDFQGQVVVLAFLDGQCQDICPRVAHDLHALHTALGERAGRVALVGVNVNPAAGAQADLARASQEWGLDQVPNWHFLSGPPEALADVWADYNIAVTPAPQEPGRVVHTAGVFIIDASGGWRWYILPPGDDDPAGGLADLLRTHVLGLLSESGPTD